MENSARSKRTRDAAIQAALTIIARDGPARLTIDAIARESGISKGGVLHQFRTKQEVLRALLDYEREYFAAIRQDYLAELATGRPEPNLTAEIAISHTLVTKASPAAVAILGAIAEEPDLLAGVREQAKDTIKLLKAEATDPDLALLRWAAARGLALMGLFGLDPLSEQERERLFKRLLDDRQWQCSSKTGRPRPERKKARKL